MLFSWGSRFFRTYLIFSVLLLQSACASNPAILVPRKGHYTVTDVKVHSDRRWLKIERNGSAVSAIPASVSIKTLYPSPKTGGAVPMSIPSNTSIALLNVSFDGSIIVNKSVTFCEAKTNSNTLFLVSNIPRLKPGPVVTSFILDSENKSSWESSTFHVGHVLPLEPVDGLDSATDFSKTDILIAAGSVSDRAEVGDYKLVLRRGDVAQVLCDSSANCSGNILSPSLLWAGDLDGDKKMDLVLWQPILNRPASRYVLYLSTAAASSQLVGEAASFEWIGC